MLPISVLCVFLGMLMAFAFVLAVVTYGDVNEACISYVTSFLYGN